MKRDLEQINSTLSRINQDHTLIDMLLEFERVLDMNHVYAYKNWINGEVVEGPFVSRYWLSVTLMYPQKMMPDPDGGLRLLKYDCKVTYEKGILEVPERVITAKDYIPGTTKAKLNKKPIWLVKITMPRRYVDEFMVGNAIFDEEVVDIEDITKAYDEDLDNTFRQPDEQQPEPEEEEGFEDEEF